MTRPLSVFFIENTNRMTGIRWFGLLGSGYAARHVDKPANGHLSAPDSVAHVRVLTVCQFTTGGA